MYHKFVVIIPNAWAAGETIEEAKTNLRKFSGKFKKKDTQILLAVSKFQFKAFHSSENHPQDTAAIYVDDIGRVQSRNVDIIEIILKKQKNITYN